jgi:hypothetical protein
MIEVQRPDHDVYTLHGLAALRGLRVNYNRRRPARLGGRDQVILHDEAQALGVAIYGRYLRVGRRALKTRDEGL